MSQISQKYGNKSLEDFFFTSINLGRVEYVKAIIKAGKCSPVVMYEGLKSALWIYNGFRPDIYKAMIRVLERGVYGCFLKRLFFKRLITNQIHDAMMCDYGLGG